MLVRNAKAIKNFAPKLKARKLVLSLGIVTFTIVCLHPGSIRAATTSSDNYQINIEQLDAPVEEQKPTPTAAPTPVPQGGNVGIAFIPTAFAFSITEPLIDFGVLSATNPVTRTTTLKVSSPGGGYQIFAYENHVLFSKKSNSIPDTTCDNGSCSETTASLWENNLTYGLGFRCDPVSKESCTKGFEENGSYKQFSNHTKNEDPQLVMASATRKTENQARITYRVNTPGTQAKETYTNTVTYIAVPNF